jgi:hypothetical protein
MRREPHTEALIDQVLGSMKKDQRGRLGFTEEGLGALAAELEAAAAAGRLAEAVRALVELGQLIEGSGKGSVANAQMLEIAEAFLPELTRAADARRDDRNMELRRSANVVGRESGVRAPLFGSSRPLGTERAGALGLQRGGRIRS